MQAPTPTAQYDSEYTLPVRKLLFQAACKYLPETDLALLERACAYAFTAHDSIKQTRGSGEPYITHPIAVATQLANWRVDVETLCAALMHDVIEDVPNYTKASMTTEFGETIANIVDGVSKLDKLDFTDAGDHKAASFRKLIMAAVKDVRVILVKISDRLHNMKTLDGVKPHKRKRTALETLELYAPIANRLGLNSVSRELQDLSFQHTHPLRYATLQKAMTQFRKKHVDVISTVMRTFQTHLVEANIEAQILGRERNLYNIHAKMQSRKFHFDEIKDIYNFTVIVNSTIACYTAMGILHSIYQPSLGKIRDYIANPKANGYQSLHTELIGPHGLPIKVQIRSRDMHAVSRFGIMAHLTRSDDNQSRIRTNEWLRSLLDLEHHIANDKEFFEYVKNDLFFNEVYVRTPKGKVITLPRGATVIDFAYAIHTDVGNRCMAARVNNVPVPLSTVLRNNDLIEVITSSNAKPNLAWLNMVVSSRARNGIRSYVKNVGQAEAQQLGQKLLQKALTGLLPENVLSSNDLLEKYTAQLRENGKQIEDVYFEVGSGQTQPVAVAMNIAALAGKHFGSEIKLSTINVNSDNVGLVSFGKCCNPIPNDNIRALFTRNNGLIIHRENCQNLLKSDAEQQLDADWDAFMQPEKWYDVKIHIASQDTHGLLAAMTSAISRAGGNIAAVETLSKSQSTTGTEGFIEFAFLLNVHDTAQLNAIVHELQKIPQIRDVKRI